MVDRTTKGLLLLVALGLWANLVGDWLRPVAIHAQLPMPNPEISEILRNVRMIATGSCPNRVICQP